MTSVRVNRDRAPAWTRGLVAPGLVGRCLRYLGGSVVATALSQLTFVALYGLLEAGTTRASVIGWLAGALPNYVLNRRWVWRRRGRADLTREILPYAAIVLTTLGLAIGATALMDRWTSSAALSHPAQVTIVSAAFLGVYGAVFVLRFLLFNRLFTRLDDAERELLDDAA